MACATIKLVGVLVTLWRVFNIHAAQPSLALLVVPNRKPHRKPRDAPIREVLKLHREGLAHKLVLVPKPLRPLLDSPFWPDTEIPRLA